MDLYDFQKTAIMETIHRNRVAYYHTMGSGKTFTGAKKMRLLNTETNLLICQKSKIRDWKEHFKKYYPKYTIADLTAKDGFAILKEAIEIGKYVIGIINYELTFRRLNLLDLRDFTLMLDESSMIQNESAKRSKFILKLGDNAANVILLSGTPTGGKYEKLWSQMHLLGWDISKKLYWNQYVIVDYLDTLGRSIPIVKGYKNVERLKKKMREHGCHFLDTEALLNLPDQNFQKIKIKPTEKYKHFKKNDYVNFGGVELVGDNTLKKMLCERQLCGMYHKGKLDAFEDLIESTDDRVIVFYNFDLELQHLTLICKKLGKPISIINGKTKDTSAYDLNDSSITFIQYQAGAMGLNLQKAYRMVFFTPPLSSELYEQAKKRIHRIGQNKPCFYYQMIVDRSIEGKIYNALQKKQDYTERLFEEGK